MAQYNVIYLMQKIKHLKLLLKDTNGIWITDVLGICMMDLFKLVYLNVAIMQYPALNTVSALDLP